MSRIQSAGARGPAFGACGLALGAYAAHKGRAVAARRGEHLEQARDVARIVLAVAVHGGDDGACRRQDAGAHRRALAAAVIMPQVVQAGAVAAFDEGLYLGSGGIRAGVVDDDHLGEPRGRQGRIRLLDEPADVARLVQRRNYDGDAHQVPLSHRQAATPPP